MKNRLFVTGMLVMALVFAMAVVGCDDGSTDNGNSTNVDLGGAVSQPPAIKEGAPGGVWVDNQGKLNIEAQLYDGYNGYNSFQPSNKNGPIAIFINGQEVEIKGSITNGIISIVFPPPAADKLVPVSTLMANLPGNNSIPVSWINRGANAKGAFLEFEYNDEELGLYLNPIFTPFPPSPASPGGGYNRNAEGYYYFFYSDQSLVINGSGVLQADIKAEQGWNILCGYEEDLKIISRKPTDSTSKWAW